MFATAAFLFSGVAFANGEKGKEKGKKKEKTHKTCRPGKECGKKS